RRGAHAVPQRRVGAQRYVAGAMQSGAAPQVVAWGSQSAGRPADAWLVEEHLIAPEIARAGDRTGDTAGVPGRTAGGALYDTRPTTLRGRVAPEVRVRAYRGVGGAVLGRTTAAVGARVARFFGRRAERTGRRARALELWIAPRAVGAG